MSVGDGFAVCVCQVWAAIPPWKQGSLAEFVVLSANEVPSLNMLEFNRCLFLLLQILRFNFSLDTYDLTCELHFLFLFYYFVHVVQKSLPD